jgi:hypothetical protein
MLHANWALPHPIKNEKDSEIWGEPTLRYQYSRTKYSGTVSNLAFPDVFSSTDQKITENDFSIGYGLRGTHTFPNRWWASARGRPRSHLLPCPIHRHSKQRLSDLHLGNIFAALERRATEIIRRGRLSPARVTFDRAVEARYVRRRLNSPFRRATPKADSRGVPFLHSLRGPIRHRPTAPSPRLSPHWR